MLTPRSVVLAALAVAMLSLLGGIVSLLQPPDQNGLGTDTYGTRAQGYKAVFSTLAELGIDQRRAFAPPSATLDKSSTLVLWGPQDDLVQLEPTYLAGIRQWVRNGGRLLIAPQAKRDVAGENLNVPQLNRLIKSTTALQEIGLPTVETKLVEVSSASGSTTKSPILPPTDEFESNKERIKDYLFPELFPTTRIKAHADGTLAALATDVTQLEVPREVQALETDPLKPDGRIMIVPNQKSLSAGQTPQMLAAQFRLGNGEVIVVGDPAVFDNRLFSQADNSVLAARLLSMPDRSIVWDEFYHGLTIRGNPLYLLTRGSYALLAAILAVSTVAWVWRKAVFLGPPLQAPTVARRTMADYVDAMANFLHRGSESRSFMLCEVRRGVLWSLRRQYGSHAEHKNLPEVVAAVNRRDPARAQKLLDAVQNADLMLSHPPRAPQSEILQATKDLLDCL